MTLFIQKNLSILDYIIFIFILFATWAFGFLSQRKIKTNEGSWLEWLVMGRKMTLPFFVTSLMATWYGGIFGVTTLTFEKGLYNFITQGLFWYFAYIIFALFIIPKIQNQEEITLPELVGAKIGPYSKRLVIFVSYFNFLPIAYVLSLGIFIQSLFGHSLFMSSCLGLFLAFSYSLLGGMRSLVYTEFIQAFTMISAVVSVVIWSILTHGSPLNLIHQLPATHFDWTGGESYLTILVWGFIAFSTLVDPTFYQRTLAMKDKKTAQRGILITTFLWFGFDLCTTLGALYARAYASHLPSDQAYLHYSLELLPVGVKGLFLAGILATILSTLDAFLFSAGSVLSYDIFGKKLFTRNKLMVGIIFSGLVSLAVIPLSDGRVVSVWKIMGGFSASCLFFPWTYTLFSKKKITDIQFSISMLAGIFSMILGHFISPYMSFELDLFYFGAFGSGISLIISTFLNKMTSH